jgi:hypothetical protein
VKLNKPFVVVSYDVDEQPIASNEMNSEFDATWKCVGIVSFVFGCGCVWVRRHVLSSVGAMF